jgi:hypothetical protein
MLITQDNEIVVICIKDYVFYHKATKKPLPAHHKAERSRSKRAPGQSEGENDQQESLRI